MSAVAVVAEVQPTLEQLAETINRQFALAEQAAAQALEHALLCGEALLQAYNQIEYGHWYAWLEANVSGMAVSTARRYMRFARWQDEIRASGASTISQARAVVAWKPSAQMVEGQEITRAEAMKMREEGLTVAQIASEFGVSRSAVQRWLNPVSQRKQREGQRRRYRRKKEASERAERERRDSEVRRIGGAGAEGFAFLRRALQKLEHAHDATECREAKALYSEAIRAGYRVLDPAFEAVKLDGSAS